MLGYEYLNIGGLVKALESGESYENARLKNCKTYGRYNDGVKFLDPRSK